MNVHSTQVVVNWSAIITKWLVLSSVWTFSWRVIVCITQSNANGLTRYRTRCRCTSDYNREALIRTKISREAS